MDGRTRVLENGRSACVEDVIRGFAEQSAASDYRFEKHRPFNPDACLPPCIKEAQIKFWDQIKAKEGTIPGLLKLEGEKAKDFKLTRHGPGHILTSVKHAGKIARKMVEMGLVDEFLPEGFGREDYSDRFVGLVVIATGLHDLGYVSMTNMDEYDVSNGFRELHGPYGAHMPEVSFVFDELGLTDKNCRHTVRFAIGAHGDPEKILNGWPRGKAADAEDAKVKLRHIVAGIVYLADKVDINQHRVQKELRIETPDGPQLDLDHADAHDRMNWNIAESDIIFDGAKMVYVFDLKPGVDSEESRCLYGNKWRYCDMIAKNLGFSGHESDFRTYETDIK